MEEFIGSVVSGMGGAAVAVLCYERDRVMRKIRYKTIKRPCPNCRDENGVPTGVVKPTSGGALANVLKDNAVVQDITFPCAMCDGKKYIVEEFRRGEVPEVDEDGRTVSRVDKPN